MKGTRVTNKLAHYKSLLSKNGIPADLRKLAIELFNLGDKKYSIDFLIKQMNRYKDPSVHENFKRETCMATAITLGRLKDSRAIEPLFEALGEINRFAAAYALAKIDGIEVEKRLMELVTLANKKGIQAAIALGFIENKEVVPALISIIENISTLQGKYEDDCAMDFMDQIVLGILGTYTDNKTAEDVFKKYISKRQIMHFLRGYMSKELYPDSFLIVTDEIGWKVTKKYNWDRYINTKAKRHACEYTTSEKLAEDLRNEIADQIWKELK